MLIRMFLFTLTTAIVVTILNAWWLMPIASILGERLDLLYAGDGAVESFNTLRLNSQKGDILSILKGTFIWAFDRGFKGDDYFPYADVYNTLFFSVGTVFVFAVGLIPILFTQKNDRALISSLFLSLVIFILLFKGIHEPFGFIFRWAFENLPGFKMFRMPDEKFGAAIWLFLSILIAIFLLKICALFKQQNNLKNYLVVSAFALAHCGLMWPFFTGDLFPQSKDWKYLTSVKFSLPDYYEDTAKYVNELEEDFKIFSVPMRRGRGGQGVAYDWGSAGSDPQIQLFNKRLHIGRVQQYYPYIDTLETLIVDHPLVAQEILKLNNIRFILLHKDIRKNFHEMNPPSVFADAFSVMPDVEYKMTFGEIDLFEINKIENLIYQTSNIVLGPEGFAADPIYIALSQPEASQKPVYINYNFEQTASEANRTSALPSQNREALTNTVVTKKATSYSFHLTLTEQQEKDSAIVMSQVFHNGWKLYPGHISLLDTIWTEELDYKHFVANGYANGWLVEADAQISDLTLIFKPQKYFYLGILVTFSACLVAVFGFLFMRFKF